MVASSQLDRVNSKLRQVRSKARRREGGLHSRRPIVALSAFPRGQAGWRLAVGLGCLARFQKRAAGRLRHDYAGDGTCVSTPHHWAFPKLPQIYDIEFIILKVRWLDILPIESQDTTESL